MAPCAVDPPGAANGAPLRDGSSRAGGSLDFLSGLAFVMRCPVRIFSI